MNKLLQAIDKIKPVAIALLALGGACSMGFGSAAAVGSYVELPQRVVQNQEDIAALKYAVNKITELLQESNCLAIAEIDPSKSWRECLTTQGEI